VSKIKNLSRAGWVIVGLVAAILLVPTMAVAATVAYNGIEGTNGTTTTQNKAQVTSAGQLLTNEAEPSAYVNVFGRADCTTGIFTIPSGKALIITGANFYIGEATAGTPAELDLDSGPASAPCTSLLTSANRSDQVESQNQVFQPGIAVPAGDVLGLDEFGASGSVSVYGYLVPSDVVPSVRLGDARELRARQSPTITSRSIRAGSA